MVKAYGMTMNDMLRKQQSNEINNEINRMIQSLTNEK
jgi:hypothetical protein